MLRGKDMNSQERTCIVAVTLFTALAIPVQLAAQNKQDHPHQYHHDHLTDSGTFGGLSTSLFSPGIRTAGIVDKRGNDCGRSGHDDSWENGGLMVDLNNLVSPSSSLHVAQGINVNDRGEIAAMGHDAAGSDHSLLLIPCDENHRGSEGCDYSLLDSAAATQESVSSPFSLDERGVDSPGISFHQGTLRCTPIGGQCRPGARCCPGLVCRPASTRAFCER
jgi:hypothetical protein